MTQGTGKDRSPNSISSGRIPRRLRRRPIEDRQFGKAQFIPRPLGSPWGGELDSVKFVDAQHETSVIVLRGTNTNTQFPDYVFVISLSGH